MKKLFPAPPFPPMNLKVTCSVPAIFAPAAGVIVNSPFRAIDRTVRDFSRSPQERQVARRVQIRHAYRLAVDWITPPTGRN